MQYENERMEFKSQLTDDIYKEVIAFTNTDGGVIYIGIDDQGNVTGIDNVDETYTRLTNGIRDAIHHAADERHPRRHSTGCDDVRTLCAAGKQGHPH